VARKAAVVEAAVVELHAVAVVVVVELHTVAAVVVEAEGVERTERLWSRS
jgi:hypothetical protein